MTSLFKLLKRPLLHVAGLSFFVNLLLLVPALFMLQVFDRVLASQSGDTLLVLLLGVGIALTLLLALDYLRSRLQGVAGNLVAEALSPTVARITVAQGARRSGRPPSEGLRDVASLRALFSSQGLLALFDAPWVVVYVGVIWLAHPALGMAAAVAAVVMLGLALLNDFLTRRDIESLQKAAGGATRYLEASLQNAEVAQAMGMTDALLGRWRAKNAEVTALQGPTARKSVLMTATTRTVRQGVQVVILALGAWLVIRGEATAGIMIATTMLLGRALAPVEQVVGSWRVLAEGRAAFRRLGELLAAGDAEPERMSLPAPTGKLLAQGLVFRAPNSERMLLAGVSLQLDAGEALADHRAERGGQEHAGAVAHRHLEAHRRHRAAGPGRPDAVAARRPRPAPRLRAAGRGAVSRHGGREHRAARRRGFRQGGAGRDARACARDDPVAARGLRHAGRPGRRTAVARPAPAPGLGARAVRRARSC